MDMQHGHWTIELGHNYKKVRNYLYTSTLRADSDNNVDFVYGENLILVYYRKNCDFRIAVADQHFCKVAEDLSSICGIPIAKTSKKVARINLC
jgi:hypothetical protein